jgi:hypothetical protein
MDEGEEIKKSAVTRRQIRFWGSFPKVNLGRVQSTIAAQRLT